MIELSSSSIFFRFIVPAWGLLLITPSFCDANPRVGIWIEAESHARPFDSPSALEKLIKLTDSPRITDLYCQVYRNGRSWFPSMLADDGPFREAKKRGVDPLAALISVAHRRGQRVHAWINVLRVHDNKDAPILRRFGERGVLRDRFGRSLLTYDAQGRAPSGRGTRYKLGTRGFWLDPANGKLRSQISEVVADLLRNYPQLDGVHLDMIRYPMLRPTSLSRPPVSYNQGSLNKFQQLARNSRQVTFDDRKGNLPEGDEWTTFLADQVTQMVREIRLVAKHNARFREFSAAVIAWPKRARNYAFQHWHTWVNTRMLDTVVPMSYTSSVSKFKDVVGQIFDEVKDRESVLLGIGAWMLLGKDTRMKQQVDFSFRQGAGGVVVFSYANLVVKDQLRQIETLPIVRNSRLEQANPLSKRNLSTNEAYQTRLDG